jgi:hypothetical protein
MNTQGIRLLYNYNFWANGQFLAPAEFPYGGLCESIA